MTEHSGDAWPIVIPRENVNDETVILLRWTVADGDPVDAGALLFEMETTKAAVEVAAEHSGFVFHGAAAGAEVPVGACIGAVTVNRSSRPEVEGLLRSMSASSAPQKPLASTDLSSSAPQNTTASSREVLTTADATQRWSQRALALAAANKIDPGRLGGRTLVRERDVQAVIDADRIGARPSADTEPAQQSKRAPVANVRPLSLAKRAEIQFLGGHARSGLLPSAVTIAVRTAGLDHQIAEAQQRRLSYLDFVIAAVARTLKPYPQFNAFYSDDGVREYAAVNVGVAVNTGDALVVPVLHGADEMSPEDINRRLAALVMAAMRRELREPDVTGGTFTVTDLSGAGAYQVQPLINRDQAAILAMGADDSSSPRLMLTLTFDHRIADGLEAAQFLDGVMEQLEAGAPAKITDAPQCSQCFSTLTQLKSDGIATYLVPVIDEHGATRLLCPVCFDEWT